MTPTATQTERPKRRRRAWVAILAALFLLIGAGLLSCSYLGLSEPGNTSAAPRPSTTMSPMTQTMPAAPTPSPGGPIETPPVVVITTYVVVPTLVAAPPASSDEPDLLNVMTTIGGLLASVVGLITAVVSVRGTRPR